MKQYLFSPLSATHGGTGTRFLFSQRYQYIQQAHIDPNAFYMRLDSPKKAAQPYKELFTKVGWGLEYNQSQKKGQRQKIRDYQNSAVILGLQTYFTMLEQRQNSPTL